MNMHLSMNICIFSAEMIDRKLLFLRIRTGFFLSSICYILNLLRKVKIYLYFLFLVIFPYDITVDTWIILTYLKISAKDFYFFFFVIFYFLFYSEFNVIEKNVNYSTKYYEKSF